MKGKIFLSLLIGASMGSVTAVVLLFVLPGLAVPIGLLVLAFTAMAMHVVLTVSEKRTDKKYAALEKMIVHPILYKTNGNMTTAPVMNCNLYLCPRSIVVASIEPSPYYFHEIAAGDILQYEFDRIYLTLYVNDGMIYRIMLADLPEVEQQFYELYGRR